MLRRFVNASAIFDEVSPVHELDLVDDDLSNGFPIQHDPCIADYELLYCPATRETYTSGIRATFLTRLNHIH